MRFLHIFGGVRRARKTILSCHPGKLKCLSVIQYTGFRICFKITNCLIFRFKLHLMVKDDTGERSKSYDS